MTTKTPQQQGDELGGLARILFDRAAAYWYLALLIEVVAGVMAVAVGMIGVGQSWGIVLAVLGFLLLCAAYYLKIRFAVVYDRAETMRRQAVFANALGWRISSTQFSEWRRLAGLPAIKQFESQAYDTDYYATRQDLGAKRLLEMTQESAFWTRHLYCYVRRFVWLAFSFATVLVFIVITFSATDFMPRTLALNTVLALTLLLPLILTIDLLGWGIKLSQLIESIKQVEHDLESANNGADVDETQVLRLVAEYNCQVVSEFPIPNWFYRLYRDTIDNLWKRGR